MGNAPDPMTRMVGTATSERRQGGQNLGSALFRRRYGLKYAYVAGAMYRGTASPQLVIRLGRAGLLGYLGTGGLSLAQIEQAIGTLQAALPAGEPYGLNLLAEYDDPRHERATVEMYLARGIRNIEAAAFIEITLPLVLFRLRGLARDADGTLVCRHRVLAKVSRLEVAEAS
ncbi:hypothetical protein [Pseudomonas piscis]|uniref:hypothetical protein n=1 Tax=Pseudomonas piscis TaxID=2614538 RepID=UPI00191C5DE9|nr:hypothetical protein [Pseudomonas piscis]